MAKVGIIVTGAEHSGTRFVSALFMRHNQVKEVIHNSVPTGGKLHSFRDMAARMKSDGCDHVKVVWVVRDATITLQSQRKVGHSCKPWMLKEYLTHNPVTMAYKYITEQISFTGLPYTFASYETLMANRNAYLSHIFMFLGLDPNMFDYGFTGDVDFGYMNISTSLKDGNKKYIKEYIDDIN